MVHPVAPHGDGGTTYQDSYGKLILTISVSIPVITEAI
jgi:hypothetical protein